jgi:hypothetical protein
VFAKTLAARVEEEDAALRSAALQAGRFWL